MRKIGSALFNMATTLSYFLLLSAKPTEAAATKEAIGTCVVSTSIDCENATGVHVFTFINSLNLTEAGNIYHHNTDPAKTNVCEFNNVLCENFQTLPKETRDDLEKGIYSRRLCDPITNNHPVYGASGNFPDTKQALNLLKDGDNKYGVDGFKLDERVGLFFYCDKDLYPTEIDAEDERTCMPFN